MTATRRTRLLLGAWTALIVAFLLAPIALIALYAFNPSNVQSWPLGGLSTRWFSSAFNDEDMRQALWLSVRAALLATAIAVARSAARTESQSAWRMSSFSNACENHRVDSPGRGQLCTFEGLKA